MSATLAPAVPAAARPSIRLFRAGWLAIVLGIALEAVALAIALSFGGAKTGPPLVADLVQKTSWSFFVCLGVAAGTSLSRGKAIVGGLFGLLAGPIAFQIARMIHKSVSEMLSLAAGGPSSPSPLVLGLIKGLEYGALGAFLAWLAKQPRRSASDYAFGGIGCGIVFGGAITVLVVALSPKLPAAAALVPRIANEVLHPIGCAMVVCAADWLPSRLRT
jgi:hypothetical protein